MEKLVTVFHFLNVSRCVGEDEHHVGCSDTLKFYTSCAINRTLRCFECVQNLLLHVQHHDRLADGGLEQIGLEVPEVSKDAFSVSLESP